MPPSVSVITINRNMAEDLARTIVSVSAQSYPEIEFLVIDGNSTDGSLEVIRQYADRIDHWVSERDKNLYDAMNKGVRAATGHWVIFMNSGDVFADANVVREVFAKRRDDADLICGHAVWRHLREGVDTVRQAQDPSVLPLGMNCSHQALFARRDLLLRHPFEDALLVADYEFMIWAWRSGARFELVDLMIAAVTAGGVSDKNRLRSLRQRWRVLRRYGLVTAGLALRYGIMMAREPAAGLAKSLLPRALVRFILRARSSA